MNKSKYVDIPSIVQVIGSIYNQPSLLDKTEKYHFYEEDFTEDFHKIIFGSMYNLHMLGATEISVNAIEDYLSSRPDKLAIYKINKGAEYLQRVSQNTQIAAFDYYYNRMKKMTLFRMYESIGVNLSWLYDVDNIFDAKKKQAQEDWLDNTSIEDIANTIDKKIDSIRLKYAENADGEIENAGNGALELLERLQKVPEVGYPLYGNLINTITRGARLGKLYLRSAATNVGKAIPNYTIIPTPNGDRRVGEIKVGDYLFGENGKPTKVLNVYPQSEQKEIWKVTFSDGRIAECCKDHLWEYRYESHRGFAYRVESVEDIYNRTLKLKNGLKDSSNKGYRFHIKINQPVEYPTKEYSIEPYVMGLLLGDGSFRYNNTNKALTFSSIDEELPMVIAESLNAVYHKNSELNYSYTFKPKENLQHNLWVEEVLKNYPDLWNAKSETKFIPSDYLQGNIEQRYDLLAGLLDTDGSIDEKGCVRFTTVSPYLRDNIIDLCYSLGMLVTYSIDVRPEKYTTGECYNVYIQCKKSVKPRLFKLTKKHKIALSYSQTHKREEYKEHLAIVNIEKTSIKTNMTCFTVDNESHLFLMNDYIVTHNTRSMVADICSIGCDKLYNSETGQWEENGTREPAMLITTEQTIDEIQTMMIAFVSDVNEEHIIYGRYEVGEWERVSTAAALLKECPIYVKELPDFSLQDIENIIKISVSQPYGVKYLAFDYIHSSMKILSEISSKAGVKGLREDNILFMISTRLKDLCNQYGIFILTATQLNGDYRSAQIYDQNLLRGAKSIADKIDIGMIMLGVTQDDLTSLEQVIKTGGFKTPKIKISIYKNRRGRYKDVLLWCDADLGTCKIKPMFVTDYSYELIQMEDLKIKITPNIEASAF